MRPPVSAEEVEKSIFFSCLRFSLYIVVVFVDDSNAGEECASEMGALCEFVRQGRETTERSRKSGQRTNPVSIVRSFRHSLSFPLTESHVLIISGAEGLPRVYSLTTSRSGAESMEKKRNEERMDFFRQSFHFASAHSPNTRSLFFFFSPLNARR